MCREEKDAWIEALKYLLNPNNFETPLLVNRWGREGGEGVGGGEGGRRGIMIQHIITII